MLENLKQLAAKVESVEGTAETLAAADAKLLAYEPLVSFDPAMFPRTPSTDSWSKTGQVPGQRPGSLTAKLMLRGSGTATTEPEWSKLLKACGWQITTLYAITIGAVTSGPFQHGELITGGTSEATGRVIIKTANGTTTLYFLAVGTLNFQNGETITGGTSGATATTGSIPSAAGKCWRPLSGESHPSLTMAGYEHEIRKLLKGCRGSIKFNFKVGEPVGMNFDFKGVDGGVIDSALLSSVTFESTKPPAFLNAAFAVNSYAAKVSQMEIDMGSVLAQRDDPNDAKGILSFRITGRNLAGSFDPEMVTVAANDFFGQLFAGTEMDLDFIVGATTGNKFRFYADKIQYIKVNNANRGGIKTADCNFDFNRGVVGDYELVILAL